MALSFWLLLALALLSAPPELTAAVLLAAALHECGHLLALAMLGAPVEGLRLSAMGAEIDARTERLSYARELAAVLAGPAVNLTCAPVFARLALRLAWDWGWLFAGAHALLGVYNLLPIPPLDGARAFYLLLSWHMGPDTGERIGTAVGLTAALALVACGAYATFSCGGALFLLAALGLLSGAVRQFAIAKTAASV